MRSSLTAWIGSSTSTALDLFFVVVIVRGNLRRASPRQIVHRLLLLMLVICDREGNEMIQMLYSITSGVSDLRNLLLSFNEYEIEIT